MLAAQLAELWAAADLTAEDRDLVFHLIASHHGHARPFAPVCLDEHPPEVRGQLAGVAIALDAGQRRQLVPAHRLDSGLADRFWRLTRRFGWWGLAYREAIQRLADWYASAHPHNPQNNNSPI
jgi:CRISPR-associated endonuclease/helicase Cas3